MVDGLSEPMVLSVSGKYKAGPFADILSEYRRGALAQAMRQVRRTLPVWAFWLPIAGKRDASGNPVADIHTNASDPTKLKIPCTAVGTTEFDGCPSHLAVSATGQKMVSYDVAAWSDLWFYSNPIYVQVANSFSVAGVK